MIPHSQLAPFPTQLPFQIVSKTIGQGAYACIKKANVPDAPQNVFAVKFIHKQYCLRSGRVTPEQLRLEVSLHQHLSHHANIVQFMATGEDTAWRWIAMELAEGGDLFDKIESDVGVGEDVAHFYFTQLISAVEYMHSKGVGHRDIKPENILLSSEGNLKLADFGLATLFEHKGKTKLCMTSCGSPPYTAPEVLVDGKPVMGKVKSPYHADLVDIWSCGVVLFVLLVGNTPWDEPLKRSYEFSEYVKCTDGIPDDELWHNLPSETVPLLKNILQVDPQQRLSIQDIRRHPWYTRQNQYLGGGGRAQNPVGLATAMFESMKIDMSQDVTASPQNQRAGDAMEIDSQPTDSVEGIRHRESPTQDIMFDWEPSQSKSIKAQTWNERITEEPSFSQFTSTPQVPLTKTQIARRFGDILPPQSLTRFYSSWSIVRLFNSVSNALRNLNVLNTAAGYAPLIPSLGSQSAHLAIECIDTRNCPLKGRVVIEFIPGTDGLMSEANFVKSSGDPVEWRRLFKKVVLICKDAVFKPDEHVMLSSQ